MSLDLPPEKKSYTTTIVLIVIGLGGFAYLIYYFMSGPVSKPPKPPEIPIVITTPPPPPPPPPPIKPKVTESKVKEVSTQVNETANKAPSPKANSNAPSLLHGDPNGSGNEIGGAGGLYGLYFSGLQTAVKLKLKGDDRTRNARLGGKVRLWIGDDGRVTGVDFLSSSGDPNTDMACRQVLMGTEAGVPPGRFNFVDVTI